LICSETFTPGSASPFRLRISEEVYSEIVVNGVGMPGALAVAKSDWIEVRAIQNPSSLIEASLMYRLGLGELSTVVLGKEIHAEIALMDDLRRGDSASTKSFSMRSDAMTRHCPASPNLEKRNKLKHALPCGTSG